MENRPLEVNLIGLQNSVRCLVNLDHERMFVLLLSPFPLKGYLQRCRDSPASHQACVLPNTLLCMYTLPSLQQYCVPLFGTTEVLEDRPAAVQVS